MRVEWTKDCALSAVRWLWVVDAVDEEGKTKDVREENELLHSA